MGIQIVCLSVRLYPIIMVKTDQPSRPTNFVEPDMTPGKVYECQNYKTLSPKKFDFLNILKIHENKTVNLQFFITVSSKKKC